MADIRLVRYRNSYGQEIFFDNKTFFAEEIHIGNTSARYNSLSLFNSPGIVTDNYSYEAMPLRFRFALKDKALDRGNRDKVFNAFTSLSPGVITIYTDENEYSIDAHLVAVPDFSRVNSHVWRWEASFIADYPFFRVGRCKQREKNATTIYVNSPVPVHPDFILTSHVYFPDYHFFINKTGDEPWVRLSTTDFSIIDNLGNDKTFYLCLSNDSTDLDDIFLYPGSNDLSVSAGAGNDYFVEWWELRGGIL